MDVFIARQAILDHKQRVFAYELLFRSGPANFFDGSDPNFATSRLIALSTSTFTLDKLTGNKLAAVNLPRELLLEGYAKMMPAAETVIEILETVEPSREIVDCCRQLKSEGYRIALDDFVYSEAYQPLVDLADIIKVDVRMTSEEEQASLLRNLGRPDLKFLAEKVESWDEYRRLHSLGYSYFQGFYFSKPEMISERDIPGQQLVYLGLLKELRSDETDFKRVENLIKSDLSLTYKLLRYVNSSWFGLTNRVESIGHALVMLGETQIRRLTSLIIMSSIGDDSPEELIVQCTVRAQFLEKLAETMGEGRRAPELFMVGLLSTIDVMLSKPMSDVMDLLPVSRDAKSALLDQEGPLGHYLRICHVLERGEWDALPKLIEETGLSPEQVSSLFLESTISTDAAIAVRS